MAYATPRAVACAAAAFIGSLTHADTLTWHGDSGVDFLDARNWDAGVVPGPDDRCLVPALSSIGDRLRLNNDEQVTIDSLTILHPEIELLLNAGATFTVEPASVLDPGIIVGRDGHTSVLVIDGVSQPTPSTVRTTSMILGDDVNAFGTLDLEFGPGLDVTDSLVIGQSGRGTFRNVFGVGASIDTHRVDVAAGALSRGEIEVNQADWSITDTFRLGLRGIATYHGGSVTMHARSFDVAVQPSSIATAFIGSGSCTIDDTVRIGVLGRGMVELSSDIAFDVGDDLVLGAQRDAFDSTVYGEGSLLIQESAHVTVGRDCWLAMLGTGELTVETGATLSVNGDVRALIESDATLRVRPSAAMGDPMIDVGGAVDPLMIVVDLAAAHDLEIGATRTLIATGAGLDATSISVIDAPTDGDRRVHLQHDGMTLSLFVTASADLTADGAVDLDDVLVILAHWGSCTSDPCPSDLTGDGTTDFNDLLRVLDAWTE